MMGSIKMFDPNDLKPDSVLDRPFSSSDKLFCNGREPCC